MRLAKIEFNNFRSLRSEVIELGEFTSLVGPNNCGKSTVLRAINLLFSEGGKATSLRASDFSVGAEGQELALRFEFTDVVGRAAEDLAHYTRDGRLVLELLGRVEGNQVVGRCRGLRYGLAECAPFYEAEKAGEKRVVYEKLAAQGASLAPWKNVEQATAAMRVFEQSRREDHVVIPSGDNAYGATGPIPRLRRHLDWIYVPAVKEASAEALEQRNTAFSKLVLIAVRAKFDYSARLAALQQATQDEMLEILQSAENVLGHVGGVIDREFGDLSTARINIGLEWDDSQTVTLREPAVRTFFRDGEVTGAPDQFGHGLQRTYIMALLKVAADAQATGGPEDFTTMLGIEEPELYQHPPQARFLSNALCDLAGPKSQVLITTHSPYFVTGRTFESIRVLRKSGRETTIRQWTIDEQRAYCAKHKGLSPIGQQASLSGLDKTLRTNIAEMFFAQKVVLVEGAEDEAIITSYLRETGQLRSFIGAGGHIVPVGGKSKLPSLIALARGFGIEVYCVFDFDRGSKSDAAVQSEISAYAADVGVDFPDEIEGWLDTDYFFVWERDIQATLSDEWPEWGALASSIAQEWGWDVDKMQKDPMLMSEAISRALALGASFEGQAALAESLLRFCAR